MGSPLKELSKRYKMRYDLNTGTYKSPKLKELKKDGECAEILEWGTGIQIGNFTMRAMPLQDYGRKLSIAMYGKLVAGTDTYGQYPSTWWDAFKLRWFPDRLIKKWPISYETYCRTKICPHIEVPETSGRHIEFITKMGE